MKASSIALLLGLPVLTLSAQGLALADDAAPQPVCRASNHFLVVSRDRGESPGRDIYVATRPGPPAETPCSYAPKAEDFVIGKDEDDYVSAVQQNILVLDSGTGPDRSLVVYDIAKRKRLMATPYDDARKVVASPQAFTFWRVGKSVKPAACPPAWRKSADNKAAKRAHRTHEVRFTLADAKPHDTGATDCLLTQDDL